MQQSKPTKNIKIETFTDYLKSLSTKDLDTLYKVLARQGKTGKNGETLTAIEIIILERI